MGLVSKTVSIKVSNTVKYYESLGYDIPKHKVRVCAEHPQGCAYTLGKSYPVKVKDLPKDSTAKVKVICDKCGLERELRYCKYTASKGFSDGKYYCQKCSQSVYRLGKHNRNFKGINDARYCLEYRVFKRSVLARDGYKCICCGKDYRLEVHHLNGFDNYNEERHDIKNGVTLCKNCHENFHSIYGKGSNTKEQFEEWYGNVKNIVSKEVPNLSEAREVYCFENNTIYKGVSDALLKLNLQISDKKEVLNCCNLKHNTYSVKGYHFLWNDIAEKMNERELKDYVLCNFDNCNRRFVIDIENNLIFDSGHARDVAFGLGERHTNYYTARYKTYESIISHQKECITYFDFIKLTKKEQNLLVNYSDLKFYSKIIEGGYSDANTYSRFA